MNEMEEFEDFLYIPKSKGLVYFFISIVILLLIKLSFFNISIIGDYMLHIIYIIISLCVLLLIKSTLNEESVRLLKFASIPFLVIAILNILMLLPSGTLVNNVPMFNVVDSVSDNYMFHSFLLIASILPTIRYIHLGSSKIILTTIVTIIILGGSAYLKFLGYEMITSYILILCYCLISFIFLKYINNYKFVREDSINYMYIVLGSITISSGIFATLILLNLDSSRVMNLIELISFITFFIYASAIIDKLINRTYKIMFSDLYEKNNDMNEINKKIVAKNRELEFSQIILNKKEKMLKTLFRNVPVPLVIINSNNNRILYSNSYFLKLIGEKKLANVINKKLFSLIKVDDGPYGGELIDNYESKILRGEFKVDDKVRYIDLEFIDNSDGSGEAIVIFNNVTTKVAVDKIKDTMNNKMMEERLKSDFLSNISHDLKTPINVIYSATQLNDVFINQENTEGLKKYNIISKHNCLLLIKLTNNLIDSSKIFSDFLSVNMKRKNIVEVVEDTVMGLVDYTKGKNIELIFDTNEEEIYVMFDEDFMQRILLNTLSNAIKFTPCGGLVEVTVAETDEDEVKIYIEDNGVGMDPDFLENAFSRYTMGKNNDKSKEKGTGIGLFVVKKLVEKQNGKINIVSKIEKGTCIELTFKKGYEYEY